MFADGLLWVESLGRFIAFVIRTCGSAPGAVVHRTGEVIRQFEQVAVRACRSSWGRASPWGW